MVDLSGYSRAGSNMADGAEMDLLESHGPMALTLLVVLGCLAAMMANLASPDLIMLGGLVILVLAGVVDLDAAFSGFSNAGMLTVAALFVVGAGLRETGAVSLFTGVALGRPGSERSALARLVLPVIAGSAFLNNTTIVATLLPAVHDWARRIGVPSSRLLMPLSFAAILGGTCTLIGTSTNLVVSGQLAKMAAEHPGVRPLGMFEISPLGIAVALAGAAVLVFLGPWLLPNRRAPVSTADDPRRYTMELMVPPGSRLAGKSIEDSGLRHLPGAFLAELVRQDEVLPAVSGQQVLREGDRLVFVGDVDAIVDLQRFPGLSAAPDQVFKLQGQRHDRKIVEAVVSERNPLVGLSIRDGGFRKRYRAVVIAVARAGERLPGRIGDIVLRPGDVLLLEAHGDFLPDQKGRNDFYLVSSVEGAAPPRFEKALLSGVILGVTVLLATLELLPTLTAALLGAGAMVVSRCCTLEEARRSLDLTVLVAIASSFGLGAAMQSSGLAGAVAGSLVELGVRDPILALALVYLVTTLLTEVVTNNAAAVLALPIAISLAERLGVQPLGFAVVVMMAASASFLTPIGYQTNLMVFNAGGYRPLDYPRLGLPLSVVCGVLTILLVPWFWPLTAG